MTRPEANGDEEPGSAGYLAHVATSLYEPGDVRSPSVGKPSSGKLRYYGAPKSPMWFGAVDATRF
jgi:hypothetical protein